MIRSTCLGLAPIAPNTKPDGSDDAAGRQKNRQVEVVLDLYGPAGA